MRLTKDQKDMLRAYGATPRMIGWIGWKAEPLVKANYLRPDFIVDGEVYYTITRLGKAAVKPKPKNKRSN